jgi:hypothetical protein
MNAASTDLSGQFTVEFVTTVLKVSIIIVHGLVCALASVITSILAIYIGCL